MPPFEAKGAYWFANVGGLVCQSVRLSVDQMVSNHYLKNNLSQSFYISHADWS